MTNENTFTSEQVEHLADKFCKGLIAGQVLRERNSKIVSRISLDDTETVILKLWTKHGLKAFIREITRTGLLYREWKVLHHLKEAGVRVPAVRGFCRIKPKDIPCTHALVMEDINPSDTALHHVSRLVQENRQQEVEEFEAELILLTAQLLKARVIDPDHSMINIIVDENGVPFRIDFELSRIVSFIGFSAKNYGQMIGHLVASYSFAVHPDVDRANSFYYRLCTELQPSKRVLRHTKRCIERILDRQQQEKGIETHMDLSL